MKKSNVIISVLLVALTNIVFAQPSTGGWTSLFDGKTLTGWHKVAGTATYAVKDGLIEGTTVLSSPNTFLISDKTYGDFVLELEVKISDTTANSGIQFRSQYNAEGNGGRGKLYGYQYELDPSARRWTGGVYDEGRRDWLYPMSLHPEAQDAFKLGQFNKVRIECIGHEIKTWVNDMPAAYLADTVDRQGVIALQVHSIGNNEAFVGEKIYWKNIRIKTANLTPTPFPEGIYVQNNIPNYLTPYEQKSGWQLLFNGKNSDGWRGAYKDGFPQKGWKITDGKLQVVASEGVEGGNGGDIVTKDQYSAFDLSFQFLLTPGANSGVKYFVTLAENNPGSAIGLEYQVLDDTLHPDAKLGREGNRTLASLYDLIKADKQPRFIRQPGEWNWGRIVVEPNNHVTHYLNGIKVLEYVRGSKEFKDLVAISKYKIWPNFGEAPKGYILLQDHGNEVSFRSIKLRELR